MKNRFIGFTSLVMLVLSLVMTSIICSCDRLSAAKKVAAERNQAIWAQAKREQRAVPILKFKKKVKIGQMVEEKLWVSDLAFGPDGKRIAVTMASEQVGARVIVIDENQKLVSQWPVDIFAGTNPHAHLTWFSDGSALGFETASGGHRFQVWNANNGKLEFEHPEPGSIIVVFSPDNKIAALDGEDFITIFDTLQKSSKKIGIQNFHIDGMQWLDNQTILVDGIQRPHAEPNISMKRLCCIDPTLKRTLVWIDILSGKITKTFSLNYGDIEQRPIQRSRDSKYLLLGDGTIFCSDKHLAKEISTVQKLSEKGISNLWRSKDELLSKNGQLLFLKSGDPRSESMLVILDAETSEPRFWMSSGYEGFTLSPDEKTLVLGDKDSLLYYDLIETPAP